MKYSFSDASEINFMNKSRLNKKEYEIIDRCAEAGYLCYLKDLQNWQLTIAPIHYDNNVIVKMPSIEEKYREDEILKKCIVDKGYGNKELQAREDISTFLNTIKQTLFEQIRAQLVKNEFKLLISMLSNLEYNVCVTSAVLGWINNITQEHEVYDDFSRNLIRTMNMSRRISVVNTEELYVTIESKFALDKLAIQKLIQLITSEHKIEIPQRVDLSNLEDLYNTVMGLARAIAILEIKQTDVLEGLGRGNKLMIDEEGVFSYSSDSTIWDNMDRYITSIKQSNDVFKYGYDNEKYDIETKKYYGIGVSDMINNFIPKLFDSNISGDSYMIAGRNMWINVLSQELALNNEESELLLSRLIHKKENNVESQFFKSNSNRALRNPLVEVGNYILSPMGLIQFSILGHYMDILEGESQIPNINKSVEKIIEDRNIDFERQIAKYLKVVKNITNVKYDIQQKSIIGVDGKAIYIPRQIDVIFYYQKDIYVIEAKHLSFKFTPKAIANEVKRYSEAKKDTHQRKLAEKIESVIENKEHVLHFLGLDPNTEVNSVKGCFITKNITISSFKSDLIYPIYNINEIDKLFD